MEPEGLQKNHHPAATASVNLYHGHLRTMSLEPERCRVTPGFPAAPEKKQAKRQMIAVQHLPEIFRRISEVEQLSPKSA